MRPVCDNAGAGTGVARQMALSSAVIGSTVPDSAVAVLNSTGGASGATFTVTLIVGAESPGSSMPENVQLNVVSVVMQVQPGAVTDTSVKPVGRLSVTMIGSTVAAVPTLLTSSVNIVCVFGAHNPEKALCRSSSGS